MKPSERIAMAPNNEGPDRCPMQISFKPEFVARLQDDMAISEKHAHNLHRGGNTPFGVEHIQPALLLGHYQRAADTALGTPEDVANEVSQRLEMIGYDDGPILAPMHYAQLHTPPKNFWATVYKITETSYSSIG